MSMIRTRWAAVGAAVAITLGAGGIGLVSATDPSDAVTFVPITPCRVMDTRTEYNVGPKTSPLGPGEVHTVNTTSGNTGDCTGIPASATGVSLNVTALDATLPTFLTVWATGEPQPDASSLNPVPGAPPTPNAVTTAINGGGQFDIYNLQGNVQVIADINGYYTDHDHDDRYYTKAQSDGRYYTQGQTDAALADKVDAATITPHLLPTAHGYLNGSNPADLRYATGVQSVTENAGSKRYEITMDNYYSFHHLVQVTLRGGYSSCPEGTQVRTSSVGGKLLIYVLNDDNTFNGDCSLDYVVYAG
jgi:hypothetical protein